MQKKLHKAAIFRAFASVFFLFVPTGLDFMLARVLYRVYGTWSISNFTPIFAFFFSISDSTPIHKERLRVYPCFIFLSTAFKQEKRTRFLNCPSSENPRSHVIATSYCRICRLHMNVRYKFDFSVSLEYWSESCLRMLEVIPAPISRRSLM